FAATAPTCLRAAHPPAIAGGTDLIQVRLLTFEGKATPGFCYAQTLGSHWPTPPALRRVQRMFLTRAGELIYDAVLTLAYPQVCVICSRSVEQRRFGVACQACWRGTRIFTEDDEICWKCGSPGPACG